MGEVQPRFKDNIGVCGCGCALEGSYRAKEWRDGTRCVRSCSCRRCLGARNKRKGQRKQAAATKAIGVPRSTIHPGHEEYLPGAVRVEVKAGAQVKPIHTRYLSARAQSEAARAIGDNRPFVFLARPDGASYGYVVIRDDELLAAVTALAENLGVL